MKQGDECYELRFSYSNSVYYIRTSISIPLPQVLAEAELEMIIGECDKVDVYRSIYVSELLAEYYAVFVTTIINMHEQPQDIWDGKEGF